MISIYFFVPSFLVLSALFLSKHRELRTHNQTLLGRLLSRFDVKSEAVLSAVHYRLYQIVQTIRYVLVVHLPEKGRVKIIQTKDAVEQSYRKQKDAVMGKKELKQNGSSSFFLRKMSEHKDVGSNRENTERGRIEDDGISSI